MTDIRRGLIIVNTGPGKGKTTAAMGTGLRAVGQGMRVLMLQFLKGSWHYGELDAVQAFGDKFVMKQMGRGFVKVGGSGAGNRLQRVGSGDPGRDQLRHQLWNARCSQGGGEP
jgi:ATP:corrinoid adenosyltransferase